MRNFSQSRKVAKILMLAAVLAFAQGDVLQRAEKALQAKDYTSATTMLREYIAAHPNDYRALFNLAYAYNLMGDRRQAEEAYAKTLAVNPRLFQARLNLAILLVEEGRNAEALPHLAAAVEEKPEHARACLLYAETLARTGDRAAARRQFDKVLVLDANSAPANLGLGRLAAEEKNYTEAEKEIGRALELNPQDRGIRLELARVYELAGNTARAAEIYERYLQEDPGFAPARRRLGLIYLEQKKVEQAAAEFEQASRLAGATEEDSWNLARTYAAAKKPDQALPYLVRLKQAHPSNFEASLLLGQMLILKRDFPAAQGALQEAIRLDPKIPDPYVDLANVMYLQERYRETLAVLDRVARLGPETPWFDWLRAVTLDKLGDAEPALGAYRRFLALEKGQYPDEEFKARQRIKVLTLVLEKGGKRRRK